VSGARVPTFGKVLEMLAPTSPHMQQEFKDGGAFCDTLLTLLVRPAVHSSAHDLPLPVSGPGSRGWRRAADPRFGVPRGLLASCE
jgi:hypothetical protein